MIYNVVLVSGLQQSDSVIYINTCSYYFPVYVIEVKKSEKCAKCSVVSNSLSHGL